MGKLDFATYGLALLLAGMGAALLIAAGWFRLRGRTPILALPEWRRPHPCVIRLLKTEDIEACEGIYRLNENRFPPGMFDTFSRSLRGRDALFLVAEVDGQVRGLGAVSMRRAGRTEGAVLSWGMVDPSFQRRGYGSALLRARLAMLPLARRAWIVTITTAGGSESFYERFGFRYVKQVPIDNGRLLDAYYVLVTARAQRRCVSSVAELLIPAPLGSTYVPAS